MTSTSDRTTDRTADDRPGGRRALPHGHLARPARVGAGRASRLAGLDYLRAMIDGELPPPPIAGLVQMDLVEAEPGRVVFTCTPDESAYNPIGAVHGGLVCTLLDSVAGCALHSTLPPGKGYTSVEIKVSYLKAVRAVQRPAHRDRHAWSGRLAGRLHRGRRHRRVRRGRRHRLQHAAGLRPALTGTGATGLDTLAGARVARDVRARPRSRSG